MTDGLKIAALLSLAAISTAFLIGGRYTVVTPKPAIAAEGAVGERIRR